MRSSVVFAPVATEARGQPPYRVWRNREGQQNGRNTLKRWSPSRHPRSVSRLHSTRTVRVADAHEDSGHQDDDQERRPGSRFGHDRLPLEMEARRRIAKPEPRDEGRHSHTPSGHLLHLLLGGPLQVLSRRFRYLHREQSGNIGLLRLAAQRSEEISSRFHIWFLANEDPVYAVCRRLHKPYEL